MILASSITYVQAIVLGLLQGVSELFPISSLGHSVILPTLLGWNIHQNDAYFISFLVATHLATAIVLFIFFWRDWVRIVKGLGRSLRDRGIAPDDNDAKLGWLLVVATIPAGILGLLFEHQLRKIFAAPESAAILLILNGGMLYGAELLRRRAPQTDADDDVRIAKQVTFGKGVCRRRRPSAGALPRPLAVRRDDGRRAARRPFQQGRRPVRVPARHSDHLRRRDAQAPRAPGPPRRRRSRPGACRITLLGLDAHTSLSAS